MKASGPIFLSIPKTEYVCPTCNRVHKEKEYYKQLSKSKRGYVYKTCKCGERILVTVDYKGDVKIEIPKKKEMKKKQNVWVTGGLTPEILQRSPKSFEGLKEGHEFFVGSTYSESGRVACYFYMPAARGGLAVSIEKQGVSEEDGVFFYKITLKKQ